jgi:hypothetical protein
MRKISAKTMPRILTDDQKQRWLHISSDLLHNAEMFDRVIPENDFQDCFRQWHHRLTKCIASQGEYFEGDSSR